MWYLPVLDLLRFMFANIELMCWHDSYDHEKYDVKLQHLANAKEMAKFRITSCHCIVYMDVSIIHRLQFLGDNKFVWCSSEMAGNM